MPNIKEIALKIANEYDKREIYFPYRDDLANFAEALIAELAKQNEPVACRYKDHNGHWCFMDKQYGNNESLYTFPPTAEQIANETAGACAKYVNRFLNGDGIQDEAWIHDIESGIRRGAWKEFKK